MSDLQFISASAMTILLLGGLLAAFLAFIACLAVEYKIGSKIINMIRRSKPKPKQGNDQEQDQEQDQVGKDPEVSNQDLESLTLKNQAAFGNEMVYDYDTEYVFIDSFGDLFIMNFNDMIDSDRIDLIYLGEL